MPLTPAPGLTYLVVCLCHADCWAPTHLLHYIVAAASLLVFTAFALFFVMVSWQPAEPGLLSASYV